MTTLTRLAAALIAAIAAAIVWVIRHDAGIRVAAAFGAELVAFVAIAVLVAAVAGPVWALIPTAVYLLIHSVSLTRRGSR